MSRKIAFLTLLFLVFKTNFLVAQSSLISDLAQDQLKAIPPNDHDSFFLAEGDYHFKQYTKEGYRRAMECYLEALKLAVKNNHKGRTLLSYAAIAKLYDANNNATQAARYYKLYYEGVLKTRPFNPDAMLKATYNIANSFANGKDADSAYLFALKMVQILPWIEDSTARQRANLLIAYSFLKAGKDNDFSEFYKKISKDAVFKDDDLPFGRIHASMKSKVAIKNHDFENALAPLMAELSQTKDSASVIKQIIATYSQLGDFKNAYHYQTLLNNADQSDKTIGQYIDYHLLEADNILQQKEAAALKDKVSSLQVKNYILLATLLLTLVFGGLLFYLKRTKKDKNHISGQQNEEMPETNSEQIADVYRKIGVTLQQTKNAVYEQLLAAQQIDDEQLQDVRLKLASINIAMQLQAENATAQSVPVQLFLERQFERALQIFRLNNSIISYQIHAQHLRMNVFQLCTLGLVITELLRNTAKQLVFDKKSEVILECREIDMEIRIDYRESKSTIADEEAETLTKVGINLAQPLLKSLNAKFMVVREDASNWVNTVIVFTKD